MGKRTGRRRTGSLYWTKSGWRARLTIDVDGVAIQKSFNLETTSKAAARVKLKRLVEQDAPPAQLNQEASRLETFQEAAKRIVGASDIVSKENREARLRIHVLPTIGCKPVDLITSADVREILAALADMGLSRDLVVHVKNDINAVLGELWRDEVIPENVVARVRVPKAKVDTRERAVLTDDELAQYLAWEHPEPGHAMAVRERQTMACVSRMFGGVRLGDLRALDWSAFETQGGRFTRGWAPRKKTARPQLLEIPDMLRPILRDWWERHGRPSAGPVFPIRKGDRAGGVKGRTNYAGALRRDLKRALGIEVPYVAEKTRKNGRITKNLRWAQPRDRKLTPRERELFEPTEYTKPVDFHSFRRAFKQALADAGVELQTAMALSGASDAKAHQRYLANTAKMRRLPKAALPSFSITHAESSASGCGSPNPRRAKSPGVTGPFARAGEEIRTLDLNLGKVALYR